ncbi:hypothetical protein N9Z18_01380 [Verrucomicrobiales bacterium]|nr:hypothetical protein [Verrucomicrobiales bacterium]MDB4358872.1 hypothetical protein [Verrucomicrobiales bacterium]
MNPIYISRYTLKSAQVLNSKSGRREHDGALIRVGDGYGCIHPWPELGDAPLDSQLERVAFGGSTPLVDAALECAEIDGAARVAGISLYDREIPPSHWLVLSGNEPEEAKAQGFQMAKIKCSADLELVRQTMRRWIDAGFRLNLDFNESLPPGSFLTFWESLEPSDREFINMVEDPEEWTEEGWVDLREAKVPLAVDRDLVSRYRLGDIYVLKPAYLTEFPNYQSRFAVTSYMDHAVGQMFAGMVASHHAKDEKLISCGLLTHRCFEKDAFFEQIQTDGPRLLPVEGTGLGFDDLLEALPWKRIN